MSVKLWSVVAGVLLAVVPAAPAWAHDKVPAASDYRTTLVTVTPKPRGLDVRVVENGSRIELRNGTGRDVTVLGYSGEAYLRITTSAVFTNDTSPTGYVNDKRPIPRDASGTAPPRWRQTGDRPVARWHDHRSHWTSTAPPPEVQDEPQASHRIRDWSVGLRVGDTPVQVTGFLDYEPPPPTTVWWAGILVVAGAVALLCRWRLAVPALGVLLGVAALTELADGVGRVLDGGSTGLGLVGRLLTTETYATVTAVAALATMVLAQRRRPEAPFALALAAACLGVLGGLTDGAVFSQAFAPVPWSGDVARLFTATTIALCAGVTVAGWLRIRTQQATPQAAAAAW